MKFRRVKAVAKKEFLQTIRDPSSILIAFILPLVLIFIMGYGISLDSKHIPFGIVSYSNSKSANQIITKFINSSLFDAEVNKNKKYFIDKMQKNKIRGILLIDENFGKNQTFSAELIADGTEPNTAGLVQKYSMQLLLEWASGLGLQNSLDIKSRYWFNPTTSSRNFLIPGSIAIVMTLISTLLTALVVAREWERGTMEMLISTPTSMSEVIVGKLIPYAVLAMGSMVLCFLISYFWYEVPFRGSLWVLFGLSILYLLPNLATGLLISILAKNQFVASLVALIVGFLPAFLLSGFLFEIHNMPFWLQNFTYIIPARYFVQSLQSLFLAGDIYTIYLKSAVGMLAVGTFIFFIATKKLKKGLE